MASSAPQQEAEEAVEQFAWRDGRLFRSVLTRDGNRIRSDLGSCDKPGRDEDLAALADQLWLRRKVAPAQSEGAAVRWADLFSGCGALSAGVFEAARALGRQAELAMAADFAAAPSHVLKASLPVDEDAVCETDLAEALPGALGSDPSAAETELLAGLGGLDLCLAGPPCQGHSSLNNHTRHDDERNDLYLRVVRFAELVEPRFLLIENVQAVMRDQRKSVETAIAYLELLGYEVDHEVIRLDQLGVPQTRRRHVVIASAKGEPQLKVADVVARYRVAAQRSVEWAIGDLHPMAERSGIDVPAKPSAENQRRMNWLLAQPDEINLPNDQRPDCHREPKFNEDGTPKPEHSYKSMYGQLQWGKPAQTITSGYGSMGQGRYVHPAEERTLTPHEAARLQMFPDFFDFSATKLRADWAKMIGNAAPMKLAYVFALEMLR